MDLHVVKGGIGKQIAFTSILDKFKDKVCVASFYPRVFEDISKVEEIYPDPSIEMIANKLIYSGFDNIKYVEPYFNNFLKGEMHLIEAYHECYNLRCDGLYHNCDFSDEQIHYYSRFIEELGDFILVQFTGSDKTNDLVMSRNLNFKTAQEIINIICHDLKLKVIDVNDGQSIYENTFVPRKPVNYREYLLMMRYCKSFISIDSCLNHMSAYKNRPVAGVCLWRDKDYSKLFSYPQNSNIMSDLPLKMSFKTQIIVDALNDILK